MSGSAAPFWPPRLSSVRCCKSRVSCCFTARVGVDFQGPNVAYGACHIVRLEAIVVSTGTSPHPEKSVFHRLGCVQYCMVESMAGLHAISPPSVSGNRLPGRVTYELFNPFWRFFTTVTHSLHRRLFGNHVACARAKHASSSRAWPSILHPVECSQ